MPQIGRRTLLTRERIKRIEAGGVLGPALGPKMEQRIEEQWQLLRFRIPVKLEEYRAWVVRLLGRGKSWKEIKNAEM